MTNSIEVQMTNILLGWCEICSKSLYEGQAFGLNSCDALTMDEIEGDIYCLECHKKAVKDFDEKEIDELNFGEN